MKRTVCLILLVILVGLTGCGAARAVQAVQSGDKTAAAPPEALFPEDRPEDLWGRDQLPEADREAYDAISAAVAARQEEAVRVDVDEAAVHLILTALRVDHPEYYWFEGETALTTTEIPGISRWIDCAFTYTMDRDRVLEAHRLVEEYTADCLQSLEDAGARTDYDKIMGVYRYLIGNTDYIASEPDQSILSVMDRHQGTCAGYARSFQYLMHRLGIPCTLAVGAGPSGESHGWNMVMCGGQWYQMDVTWGDPVDQSGAPGDDIQYTYCMITDGEMYRDHRLSGEIPMPQCTATEYNYFVRTGRQFDHWDRTAYLSALEQAVEAREPWLSVRFTGQGAYEDAAAALFDRQEIWDLMAAAGVKTGPDGRIVYARNDEFLEISLELPAQDTEE